MAPLSEIRAVLFDAAGTLIEPREPVGETYARMACSYGVALPARRLGDAFRRTLRRAPPLVFPDAIAAEIPRRERDWWRVVVWSTFFVGDSAERDLAGARATGMRAIDVGDLATLRELPDCLGALAAADLGPPDG